MHTIFSNYAIHQSFTQWIDYLQRVKQLRLHDQQRHAKVTYPQNHPWNK